MLTNHTDTNRHIAVVHDVLSRDWARWVLQNWKMEKCSGGKLSPCARCDKRKLVLEKNHDPELIGEPAEATKMALVIDDVIKKLFYPISSETLFRSNGFSVTNVYGNTLWFGFGCREFHLIGRTEKY